MKKLSIAALIASVLAVGIYVSNAQDDTKPPETIGAARSVPLESSQPFQTNPTGPTASSGVVTSDKTAGGSKSSHEVRGHRSQAFAAAALLKSLQTDFGEEFVRDVPTLIDERTDTLFVRGPGELQDHIAAHIQLIEQATAAEGAVEDSSSTGPAGLNSTAAAEPASRELRIYRLKHIPAADLLNAVKDLYREEFDGQLPAAVDEGSNALLVRSSREFQAEIEALAKELDQPAADPAGGRSNTPVPTGRGQPAAKLILSNKAAANNNPLSLWDGDGSTLQALANDYEAKNQESLHLAAALRNMERTLPPNSKRLLDNRMRLGKAVESAFEARQLWHQAEVSALRARLEPLETLVNSREQAREEIIKSRVEFLLRPERQWDVPGGARGRSGSSLEGSDDRSGATAPADTLDARSVWLTELSVATERAELTNRPLILLFTLRWSAPSTKVTEQLTKPDSLELLARRFVAVHVDADTEEGKKVAHQFGITATPSVLALTPDMGLINQWVGTPLNDAGRSKLLKNLEDVAERMEVKTSGHEKQPPEVETTFRGGGAKTNPVWLNDFSKATEQARKIHRPLVVLFTLSESSLTDREVVEQLMTPEALSFLALRFVAVHIHLDNDAGKKVGRQFNIESAPTVLALTPRQEPIHRWVGTPRTDTDRNKFLAELADKTGQVTIRGMNLLATRFDDAVEAGDDDRALDPRRLIIETDVAIARARNAVEEREQHVKARDQILSRVEEQYKRGTYPLAEFVAAESEAKSAHSALKKAQIDLNAALAKAEAVREHLRTQQRLVQLKLEDASLQLEQARKDLERARQLHERHAISIGEFELKELAEAQAKLKVRRAEMLLEAYRGAAEAKHDVRRSNDQLGREEEEEHEVVVEVEEVELENGGEVKKEDIESNDEEAVTKEEIREPGIVEIRVGVPTDGDEDEDRAAVEHADAESHEDEPDAIAADEEFKIEVEAGSTDDGAEEAAEQEVESNSQPEEETTANLPESQE